MIVVDANIVIKWFVPEPGSDSALAVLDKHLGGLLAPDLLAIEVSAAFVRKANMDKSQRDGALLLIDGFHRRLADGLIELRRSDIARLEAASRLALDLGHPFKDCVYLALAIERDCPLITADARFADKAAKAWGRIETLAPG